MESDLNVPAKNDGKDMKKKAYFKMELFYSCIKKLGLLEKKALIG